MRVIVIAIATVAIVHKEYKNFAITNKNGLNSKPSADNATARMDGGMVATAGYRKIPSP